MHASGIAILLDLDRDDLGLSHLLIDKLDDALELGRDGVGHEHES